MTLRHWGDKPVVSETSDSDVLAIEEKQVEAMLVEAADEQAWVAPQAEEWVFESLEDMDDRVLRNPEYLKKLQGLDQDYIDQELDKNGEVMVRGAATISVDIGGFSAFADEELSKSYGPQKAFYAAERVAKKVTPVRGEVVAVSQLYGGEVDQFLGDGMNGMFRGPDPEQNVARAMQAAKLMQERIRSHGLEGRIGIDFGDVKLVGYGDAQEKRADMTGPAVLGAEAVQAKAQPEEGAGITLSESAYKLVKESRFVVLENGAFALQQTADKHDINIIDTFATRNLPDTPEGIELLVKTREKFLAKSRRKELRKEFLYGIKPKQDAYQVGTVFVKLKDTEDRRYQEINEAMTSIFEIARQPGGKIDKVHNDTVMINFIAGRNQVDSMEASKRIADRLQELNESFAMSASRSHALVLSMDGVRTVYGQGVIRARRLLDVNNPGGVLVVDQSMIERMIARQVKSEEIAPVAVKGFQEPVRRHIIHEIDKTYELPQGKEVVGRAQELGILEADFEASKKGGRARVIVGEPGVGKSTLTSEFLAIQKAKTGVQANVLVGRAEPYTSRQAFSVWRNLLENSLDMEDLSLEKKQIVLEDFYSANAKELLSQLSLLNPILGTNFEEDEEFSSLSQADRSDRRADLIAKTLKAMTSIDRPTVVLLEDLHWFDNASEELAREVVSRIKGSDAYLLITTWPTDPENKIKLPKENFLWGIEHAGVMELGGLPVFEEYTTKWDSKEFEEWWSQNKESWWKAVNTFIDLDRDDFLEKEHGPIQPHGYMRIFAKLSEKTKGNYLLLGNAINYLVKYEGERRYFEDYRKKVNGEEVLVYGLGKKRIEDRDFDQIPNMEAFVQTNLETIDQEVRSFLQDASVVGFVFTPEIVEYISGVPKERSKAYFRFAEIKGFIRELGGGQYMFSHGSMEQAVYNSFGDPRDRQIKHRILGEYYLQRDPDNLPLLVRHYRNSDDYVKAMGLLDRYGKKLNDDVLWGAAANQIEDARAIFQKVRERGWHIVDVTVRENVPAIELDRGKIEELVHDEMNRSFLALRLWRKIGDHNKILPMIERAQEVFAEFHGSDVETMAEHDKLIWMRLLAEESRERAGRGDLGYAATIVEEVQQMAEPMDAVQYPEAKLEALRKETLHEVYFALSVALEKSGQHELALVNVEKALLLTNQVLEQLACKNLIAICYARLGQSGLAEQEYISAINTAIENRFRGSVPALYSNLADFYAAIGDRANIEKYHNKAYETAKQIGQAAIMIHARGSIAFIRRNQEKYDEAWSLFDEVRDEFLQRGQRGRFALVSAEMAFCAIKLGWWDRANESLIAVQNEKTQFEGRGYTLGALRQLTQFGVENLGEIEQEFDKGVELLRPFGRESSIAFDSLSFGEELIKQGLVEKGRVYIECARELYENIGESAQKLKIEKILRDIGVDYR